MNDTFDLPIIYNGKELAFKSQLLQFGYIHKFAVDINGNTILFEQDEEGSYRAMIEPSKVKDVKSSDIELFKVIAHSLEALLK